MLIYGSGSNVCLSVCLKCNIVETVDLSRCRFVSVVLFLLGMVLEILSSVHRLSIWNTVDYLV